MCPNCFSKEYLKFESFNEFEPVRIQIENSSTLRHIGEHTGGLGKPLFKIFGIGFGGRTDFGFDLYQCEICNEYWKLAEPDYAWRGYLLKASAEDIACVQIQK